MVPFVLYVGITFELVDKLKSSGVMIVKIKLFGGTFFSQHFYNNIYTWDLEILLQSTSEVKVHYSSSACVVSCMSIKNIKNTTCIKTVIFASFGTFVIIGNSVPGPKTVHHALSIDLCHY